MQVPLFAFQCVGELTILLKMALNTVIKMLECFEHYENCTENGLSVAY